jgi:uncharacterized cupredoxin-like copper-binding protein
VLIGVAVVGAFGACDGGASTVTPVPSAGSSDRPRDVNLIARDYSFEPDPVDLVPGETVVLHVVNAGLDRHEAIIGDAAVQDAWEAAHAAVGELPPGQTPSISVSPDLAGVRIVVESGQRADLVWPVPADAADVRALIFGCHIPGHYAQGMRAAARVAGEGT